MFVGIMLALPVLIIGAVLVGSLLGVDTGGQRVDQPRAVSQRNEGSLPMPQVGRQQEPVEKSGTALFPEAP